MILSEMLRDHVVRGQPILPAAAAIEMIAAALRLERGCLERIALLRPIFPPIDLRLEIDRRSARILGREGAPHLTMELGAVGRAPEESLAAVSGEALDRDRIYEWFASLGISYGPWFRTIVEAERHGERVRARLRTDRRDAFLLHPAILDGALQALGCAAFGRKSVLYLPHAIERLEWFAPLGEEVLVEATVQSADDALLRGDVRIFDLRGRPLARIAGIDIKRIGAAPRANGVHTSSVAPSKSAEEPSMTVLHVPVEVPAPRAAAGDRPVAIHRAGRDERAVEDFIRWAKGQSSGPICVIAELGVPESEAVLGAARSLRLERPDLKVRAIAVSPRTTREIVEEELLGTEPEVLLDGAHRSVRAIAPLAIEASFELPRGAPVVITGGIGGIGLALARRLFERFGARLVLIARKRGDGDPIIRDLSARGAEILLVQADVTDRDAMSRALEEARARFGAMRAVFHAAGLVRDKLLLGKTDEDVRAVLGPKIRGTRILDELTRNDPIERFVLFSSIVSYTGNYGQTDYAAANRFLDAYARKRSAEGRRMQSIAFGPWAEIGMAAPLAELARRRGIEPLEPSIALAALERALAAPHPEILIAHLSPALLQAGLQTASKAKAPKPEAPKPASHGVSPAELERTLVAEIARFLEVEPEHLDPESDVRDFGVDSILGAQLLRELEKRLSRPLDPALLFESRSIRGLAERLGREMASEPSAGDETEAPSAVGTSTVEPAISQPRIGPPPPRESNAVAVIGWAARHPGERDPDRFFQALLERRSFIREIPRERFDVSRIYDPSGERPGTTRAKWGVFLDDIESFDPLFFGISPREATLMDPQQRLLLDVAWSALEHAGYGPRLAGTRTGVFVGGGQSEYGQRFFAQPESLDGHTATGNSPSILSNRLSYTFDLKGPSLTVDTACSSSLVALHLARESVLSGESELALVAGVNVLLRPELFIAFSRGQLLSPTGRALPFSPEADGYVRSEAAAALLLKPLDRAIRDGDTIHAVIVGSAVAQDGRTVGLTTPDVKAQVEVMTRAARAIDPKTIDHVEAHAVGSLLGDMVELEAIARAGIRGTVGSIKGNVGHAEIASGLLSVIKVLLAFAKGTMPPVAGSGSFPQDGLQILDAPRVLRPGARALVNAFGFGGTNASVVLERPPEKTAARSDTPGHHLLFVSARSESAFRETARRLADELASSREDAADICFTQSTGRRPEPLRAALIGDRAALREALASVTPAKASRRPKIAFLFTGQGSQYAGMGAALYGRSAAFRDALDRCDRILADCFEVPLVRAILDPDPSRRIDRTLYTQPALFALEWAVCEMWRAAGVTPSAVLGHSVGELVAATVAGVMSLENGLRLTYERARLLQALPEGGAMAAILAPLDLVSVLIEPHRRDVDIAAINGRTNVVISGSAHAVDAIVERASSSGARARRLTVSHAFHSPLVEPMLDDFERAASAFSYGTPKIAFASNLLGRVLTPADRIDAAYWRRHVREPVRFCDVLGAIDADLFLEVGPDGVLTALARAADKRAVASLRRGTSDERTLMEAAAALFSAGVDVDLAAILPVRRRVPSTPSVREPRRLWHDDGSVTAVKEEAVSVDRGGVRAMIAEEVARILKLEPSELSHDAPLSGLGLDSLMAIELAARLEGRLGRSLPLDGAREDMSIDDLVAELAGSGPIVAQETAPSLAAPPVDLDPTAYAAYARPATMERLSAGALDKIYVEAKGDRMVFLEEGRRVEVLDLLGGFGSTIFGHNHPELVAHVQSCLQRAMPVHAQGAHHANTGRLAKLLSERLDPKRRFISTFVNTGSEAVEIAIKHAEMEYAARADAIVRQAKKEMARALHDLGDIQLDREIAEALGLPEESRLSDAIAAIEASHRSILGERPAFFALERSFHGKTSGAARLTASSGYRTRFSSGIRVERISIDDPDELEARATALTSELLLLDAEQGRLRLNRRTWTRAAGLFVEPVQGEGGVRPLSRALIDCAHRVAERHGFPIVVDEIQAGFGRCGAFSAAHALGLSGDYYLFGKALGGGLTKIAVLMVDEARYQREFGLAATSTFSEDDPSITCAIAALELYDRDRIEERARTIGAELMHALDEIRKRHPSVIREVRGMGLLIGVELADLGSSASPFLRHTQEELGQVAASWFLNTARIRFLPMSSATNTIRLEPSAYLSSADRDRIVAAFERFAEIVEKGNVAHLVGPIAGISHTLDEPVRDWRHAPGHEAVAPQKDDARVAFITYFTEESDLLDFCPAMDELPADARARLIEKLHRLIPPRPVRSARVRSRNGRAVHLEMIGLLATSEQIEAAMRAGDLEWIRERIDEAVELAIQRGAKVVGFGGLTSIVTHNARLAATREVALTTGNALTVAMGIEAIESGCRASGIDLGTATVAIVGAAGNIGATYAECIAEDAPRVLLVGRKGSRGRLESLANQLYLQAFERMRSGSMRGLARSLAQIDELRIRAEQGESILDLFPLVDRRLGLAAPVRIASDLSELARANVILAASNSARAIIEPEHLGPGPIVLCDVAVPRDVSPRVAAERPDARVLVGGAVQLPQEINLDLVAGHLPRGHVYACMAETMLLGLEGVRGHFSFGPIRKEAVRAIGAMAKKHGFELGMVEDRAAKESRAPHAERRAHDRAEDA